MNYRKIGFIGAGNMAAALAKSIVSAGLPADHLLFSDISNERTVSLCSALGAHSCLDNIELAENSDIIFLAVKPNVLGEVIDEIKAYVYQKLIVSIVGGFTVETLNSAFGGCAKILRIMPNTPALVGEGMFAFSSETTFSSQDIDYIKSLLKSAGRIEVVEDQYLNAVTGLSGSGPAFAYLFIEALADGGVQQGLPRSLAYELAAQTVLGAAKMVLETKESPGSLKDAVCSPGGTTIEGVFALEKNAFRGACMEAVRAASEKSRELSLKAGR
jgi:pyrroline-5-carboxylate reductase